MNIDPESDFNWFRVLNKSHPRKTTTANDTVIFFINEFDEYGLVRCPRILKWETK
jgi:hypothetical protein